MAQHENPSLPNRWPISGPAAMAVGVGLILACHILLFVDVQGRGGMVVPLAKGESLGRPAGVGRVAARWVAINMTPLCWVGYLLVLDGLLATLGRRRGDASVASVRSRPRRFVVAYVTSVPVWCFFDGINHAFVHAWQYHNLPSGVVARYTGFFVAFGTITPAMLLTAQLYQHLGLRHLGTAVRVRIGRALQVTGFALGVLFIVFPFWARDPVGTLTLWLGLVFLVDPVNHWLGAPSLIGDWQAGRWGRTVSLMAAGATCGLFWEFWNYWAVAKWTYSLPFLGWLEQWRYFEMPWVGFLGFLPFALECWVALNFIVALAGRTRWAAVEPLPGDDAVI